ncbi:hypothetical protein LJ739_16815 [Aestuariibacter halophilus]|uniref:Prephenate dehydrogenase n=1 Tax=Fluctibacter halophilus TaxID=226011 RepID=A0ABS8GBF8_9ALTE|nr:hypothetical protein [Aestuariibacter halophilus]MCC2617917.1 hypothetical protein [Aestuariibacter halophilus]
MQGILDKLAENLQHIYRQAIDADDALAKLAQQGHGKFQNVFAADAGFSVASKRFMPYVEEVAKQVAELSDADDKVLKAALPALVKKIELLHVTLANFKSSLKAKP